MTSTRLCRSLIAVGALSAAVPSQQMSTMVEQSSLGSSRPRNLVGDAPDLWFAASDGLSGVELWRYDGTIAVRAANVGPDTPGLVRSSFPDQIVRQRAGMAGSEVFFSAIDPGAGRELRYFDGATLRTFDTLPGPMHGDPRHITRVGTSVWFSARTAAGVRRLFVSDGTTTIPAPGTAGLRSPYSLLADGGTLYCAAADSSGSTELWKIDNGVATAVLTPSMQRLVAPDELTQNVHGIYCSASIGGISGDRDLVFIPRSGPQAGTVQILRWGPAAGAPLVPDQITASGSTIACTAKIFGLRQVLRVDDATLEVSTTLIPNPGRVPGGSTIEGLTGTGGSYWFTLRLPNDSRELWHLAAGSIAAVAVPLAANAATRRHPRHLHASSSNALWFSIDDDMIGTEPWQATPAAMTNAADIRAGVCSGAPTEFTQVAGRGTAFAASGPGGRELYVASGGIVSPVNINLQPPNDSELHAEPDGDQPDRLEFKICSPPGSTDAIFIGLAPPIPLPIPSLRGTLRGLLLVSAPIAVAGPLPSTGFTRFTVPFGDVTTCNAPAPVLMQNVNLSAGPTGPRLQISDPVSVTTGCANCRGAELQTIGSYNDRTGEYKIRAHRPNRTANPGVKYVALARQVRATGEVHFIEARPIERSETLLMFGVIDLHLPVSPGDVPGDRLLLFYLPDPPTQEDMPAVPSPALAWISYC